MTATAIGTVAPAPPHHFIDPAASRGRVADMTDVAIWTGFVYIAGTAGLVQQPPAARRLRRRPTGRVRATALPSGRRPENHEPAEANLP